ncbi:MAG: hypothetical protein Q4F97_00785 [Bacteroidales bacterium]|nr:hypothetical protein [Bacteroidales bacterium]
MSVFRIINNADELVEASNDRTARYLIIRTDLKDVPEVKLLPFQNVIGEFDGRKISFKNGSNGFCLTKGNELKNLKINVDPDKKAIYQDSSVEKMSTHHLSRINVTGQISFIVSDNIKKGKIEASFIHVNYASTEHLTDRPNRYGVDMMQGAMTVWNKTEELNSEIEVDITHFSCGSETKPINGSGLLICGVEEKFGTIRSDIISCGNIYTSGEIGEGVSDKVAAGIVVGYEVVVKNLTNYGKIYCYGANEMGLYNWGTVERWSVTDRIETHGVNSCGFINAGNIGKITFTHTVETFGIGSRGFYMFDGVAKDIHFERIVTHGDAAPAIQFNRFISRLSISNGIETFGNSINVLFADVVSISRADAISIRFGGVVGMLKITGDVVTNGKEACSIYDETSIEKLYVSGSVIAKGEKSMALQIKNAYFSADDVKFISDKYAAVVLSEAKINNSSNLTANGKNVDIIIDIHSSIDKQMISNDSLKGVFQDNVRIDYMDNVEMEENNVNKPQDKQITPDDYSAPPYEKNSLNSDETQVIAGMSGVDKYQTKFNIRNLNEESFQTSSNSKDKPHPMACEPPKDIKAKDEP